MSNYKNEYQKYADDAVRGRASEEGFGRLRLSLFLGLAGAVILLIINFIRLPNQDKASAQALLISLVSLVGAAANIALLKALDLFPILST